MTILVTGSSGFIGSVLVPFLIKKGHKVVRLIRSPSRPGPDVLLWDPGSGVLDGSKLEGFDAVVHLAGENLATGRWTEAKKAAIRDSRVRSTRLLCDGLRQLRRPPKVLALASGIGLYGNRGAETLTEESSPGTGFLAEVSRQWEDAAKPGAETGIRLVHLRFGIVLSSQGGALAKMLLPFKLGLGGVLGNGAQYWSWITIDDAVEAIYYSLVTDRLFGPLNIVSPQTVTNREFTRTLGSVLGRPTLFRIPAFVARAVFGEMADQALLASTRAVPAKLLANQFVFQHGNLSGALRYLLQK